MSNAAERPDGLTPLGRLSQYMNFRRLCKEPPVFVVEDHRAVLVAAWAAMRQGVFGNSAPILLRLDAHPDMGERPRPWAWEKSQLADLDTLQALANDQRHDDGGWVITAMQWGLCSDVISCLVHDYHRFPGDSGVYTDHTGVPHRHWTFSSVNELLESVGRGAAARLGWDCGEGALHSGSPLWLDIDLDFATSRLDEEGNIRPWTHEEWDKEFSEPAQRFLGAALRSASLVTIASEPEFCGGLEQSGAIAGQLRARLRSHAPWLARL